MDRHFKALFSPRHRPGAAPARQRRQLGAGQPARRGLLGGDCSGGGAGAASGGVFIVNDKIIAKRKRPKLAVKAAFPLLLDSPYPDELEQHQLMNKS